MNYLPGFFIFLGGMIVGGVVVHLIHEYLDAMLPLETIDKDEEKK